VEQLTIDFQKSVDYVQNSSAGKQLSNQLKLKMYALYKQATKGDISGDKPGMLEMIALAKYMAWEKLQGLARESAMREYVDQVTALENEVS